jgi:hypothetical protein
VKIETKIVPAEYRNNAGILGAAALAAKDVAKRRSGKK